MKRFGRKTAEELLRELEANPQWVAEQEERERALQERVSVYRKAELPLVHSLNLIGLSIESVWDLVNTNTPYPTAVPILLKHLTLPYPERVREGIARALAVPEARVGWKTLLEAFLQEPDTTTSGVKWAIALALGAAGTDESLDDVLPLVRDRSLGRNRVPLLLILGRSCDPRARELLEELRADEEIAREAKRILRKRRTRKEVRMSDLAD